MEWTHLACLLAGAFVGVFLMTVWRNERRYRREQGVELRGGGADEAPGAYKRLPEVLAHHGDTIAVLHTLRPIGVAMAGANEVDPYKD